MAIDSLSPDKSQYVGLCAEIRDLELSVSDYRDEVKRVFMAETPKIIIILALFLFVWRYFGGLFPLIMLFPLGQFVFVAVKAFYLWKKEEKALGKAVNLKADLDRLLEN